MSDIKGAVRRDVGQARLVSIVCLSRGVLLMSLAMPGICDLICRWVKETPDSLAVDLPGGNASLTYRELWEHAGWLAARLTAAGMRPGDLVGVDLRRGPELIIAFSGVMRTGAAYLPVGEQAPAERIAGIFAEAGVAVVVTAGDRVRIDDVTHVEVPTAGHCEHFRGGRRRASGREERMPSRIQRESGRTCGALRLRRHMDG